MIPDTNLRRSLIGCWALAALLLVGYNLNGLARLADPSPPPPSRDLRDIRRQWQELEESSVRAAKQVVNQLDIERILAKFKPGIEDRPQGDQAPEQAPGLPQLTGILRISDVKGNIQTFAVLEGRRVRKNETLQGYTVRDVTKQGVVLEKEGETWSLPVPEGRFSLIRVESEASTGEVEGP